MSVLKGKVVGRQLFIEVEGRKHYMPKGCDPIIGPQLEAFADRKVEVLMARDTVLAIRLVEPDPEILRRIILCYLCPPHIVFDPGIMRKLEPMITESLAEIGYLGPEEVEGLQNWVG